MGRKKMNSFIARFASLAILTFLLWIASLFVQRIVSDRMQYKQEAKDSVAQSFPQEQEIIGPIISIAYEEKYSEEVIETINKVDRKLIKQQSVMHEQFILPETLRLVDELNVAPRTRGLFSVNTFQSKVILTGNWQLPDFESLERSHKGSKLIAPTHFKVLVSVKDARGLANLIAKISNVSAVLEPTISRVAGYQTATFNIPISVNQPWPTTPIDYDIQFDLSGTDSIAFVPLGKQNQFKLQANWPHPSFNGALLPKLHQVNEGGFSAVWDIASLSVESRKEWIDAASSESIIKSPNSFSSVGVRLMDPVDIYVLSNRASKYAMLFVILVLGAFVLFELFKHLRIHPVQYLLVGVALIMFFLMLISLSEHIGFAKAYGAAASASCLLISFYAGHALGNFTRAIPLTVGLSALYGALYGLLNSEQNALVLGSLMLFLILACIMIATRKTDWYELLPTTIARTKNIGETAS